MKVPNNYGGLAAKYSNYQNSKFVIIPVPFDGTSTWGKGADKGPSALISASQNMELYDIESNNEPFKVGIYTDQPTTERKSPEKMVAEVKRRVLKHMQKNKISILLGGEHSVSIGAIQALAQNEKFSVLQLDAHSDMRDEYEGSRNNHACIMARAKEVAEVVQVGIRSQDVSELKNIQKNRIFYAEDIIQKKDWIKKVVKLLRDKVYLTIDLDVFDPSIVPSTGTPEPGGLDWYMVLALLKEVINQKKLIGFDVVELAPNKLDRASDFLAAKLIYKIISYYQKK